jgi:predicted aspartyl protease
MLAMLAAAMIAVPFEVEDARLYVPVELPGAGRRWFILDSGAASTVLDTAVASDAGLALVEEGTQGGAGPGQTAVGSAKGVALSVGGVRLVPRRFSVLALDALLSPSGGRRAPGIVGAQFFLEHVVELDFESRTMRVFPPGTRRPGRAVPVELVSGTPLARGSLQMPGAAAIPARMLIDLGAKATLLVSEPFMARHGMEAKGMVEPLGAGLGGETRYAFARVPRIEVGGLSLRDAVAGFSVKGTLRAEWYDALLGLDFLSRFRVVFDLPRSRILLTPRDPMPAPAEADMSGMFLLAGGPRLRDYKVAMLVPGGPAAAAGVRAGDGIDSVDGRPASALTLSEVRQILRGGDRREVLLTLRRGEGRISARPRLRRLP